MDFEELKIHLGRRIDINTWKNQYKDNTEVCERIEDFLLRHTYAMLVLSFQMTKEINFDTLREFNPGSRGTSNRNDNAKLGLVYK